MGEATSGATINPPLSLSHSQGKRGIVLQAVGFGLQQLKQRRQPATLDDACLVVRILSQPARAECGKKYHGGTLAFTLRPMS